MKTVSLRLIFAVFSALPFAFLLEMRAAPEPIVASVVPRRRAVEDAGIARVGASRELLLRVLGEPDEHIGDKAWIYWDCLVRPPGANPKDCDTLVAVFEGDFVSMLKAVSGAELRRALKLGPASPRLELRDFVFYLNE